jgi:hypothetical protein
LLTPDRVSHDAGTDGSEMTVQQRSPAPEHVLPADGFERRASDLRRTALPGPGPDFGGLPGFQALPCGSHHSLVEVDQRLGDAVARLPGPEEVGLAHQQLAVFQHRQRVRNLDGLPPDVAGDASPGSGALGDSRQNRVIEGGVPDVGLGGQQVPRFPEERAQRRKHRPADPVVEFRHSGRRRVGKKLPPVSGRPAEYGKQARSQRGLAGGIPEVRCGAVTERLEISSSCALPRSGAPPASMPPITDKAEPQISRRIRFSAI